MLQNKVAKTVILIFVIVFSAIIFYWFFIRPTNIRKACSNVDMKPYSQEEKGNAKKKFEDNHCLETMSFDVPISGTVPHTILGLSKEQTKSVFSNLSKDEARKKVKEIVDDRKETCSSLEEIFNSPDEKWRRQATDDEYSSCLRNNGFDVYHSATDNRKLESIQQGIVDRSTKMDELQSQEKGSQKEASTDNTQSIIQSAIEKTNQEEQAKCQQELNEYNSCLAEYNSKMAEYTSCLTEEANPNYWNYGKTSLCFKPSNYCFKPTCAY